MGIGVIEKEGKCNVMLVGIMDRVVDGIMGLVRYSIKVPIAENGGPGSDMMGRLRIGRLN